MDKIWFDKNISISSLEALSPGTMAAHLGMEWDEIGHDFLKLSMPVDERTRQPYGLLHGGASCALAETIGSIGSHLIIDPSLFICVGQSIDASHIRSVQEGRVTAFAFPVHIGSSTHVWSIDIFDNADKLICTSRLTVAILKKRLPEAD